MENKNIGCTVNECKHNNNGSHCCTLERIQVKCHTPRAESPECTDCASFTRR